MSFLNSVLSSIGGEGPPPSLQPAQSSRPGSSHNSSVNSPGNPTARTGAQSVTSNLKRKAEDGLSMPNAKLLKESKAGGKSVSGTLGSPSKMQRPTLVTSSAALAVPYRGTSKSNSNSASPITPIADTPKAPPKKGSFAEIMARAKASQMTAPAVGMIKHKPTEALSNKKEILLQKQGRTAKIKTETKDAMRRGMPLNDCQSPDSGTSTMKTKSEIGGVNKKSAQPPTYKGTANAKPQPSYKGTMNLAATPVLLGRKNSTADKASPRRRSASKGRPSVNDRYNRYLSEDEDDEDDEEDDGDGDDPGGESSDDMEAGFSDVEEEEVCATKFARKEDEEQARIELQMKREKEERKKRLQMMAKSAKKRSF